MTDYYVEEYGRNSAIRRCDSTRCTVLGLSNGVGYRFAVAAVNRFGRSAYSAPSNVVTPTGPASAATVTITFNANGGSGTMASESEPYGTTAALTLNTFTYSGYTFNEWNSEADGDGTTFTNGELVKFTGSATFYAQWIVGPPTSTVVFNANGGSGTMASETESVATALTLNAFTRTGYTFSSWSTTTGGSGTSYANGATYAFTASVTLYAQWTATSPTGPFTGTTDPNWSGYVLSSTSDSAVFTEVSGEWTVPTLNCSDTPNSNSATWVGTGGDNWSTGGYSGTLLQTGTEDDCVNGVQEDAGWFEILPSNPNYQETFNDFPVSPGDTIAAEVAQTSEGQWATVVKNLSTGLEGIFGVGIGWEVLSISTGAVVGALQGVATGTSYSGADSAEWIVEDPENSTTGSYDPFANYGTVTFSDLTTDLSSWTLPNSDAYEIVGQSGATLSAPSAVVNDGFTVYYTGP